MFNNVAVDVSIGLIFIFLLYSLLATIIQEIVARMLSLRARMLVKAVRVMLQDRNETYSGNWSSVYCQRVWHSVSDNVIHFFCPFDCDEPSVARAFYKHPTIKYLTESSWHSKPAYISPDQFADTMIRLLRTSNYDGSNSQINLIRISIFEKKGLEYTENGMDKNKKAIKLSKTAKFDEETLQQLEQLYHDSHNDVERLRGLLVNWYSMTMDRVNGWYKRQTAILLFLIGIIIAVCFNVDTICIARILSKNDDARKLLVELAVKAEPKYKEINQKLTPKVVYDTVTTVKEDTAAGTSKTKVITAHSEIFANDDELNAAYKTVRADIDEANNILGLGRPWKDTSGSVCQPEIDAIKNSKKLPEEARNKLLKAISECKECKVMVPTAKRKWLQYHPLQQGGISTIAGWLLTALAISLGAPFWFDLLNRFVALRAGGKKPENDTSAAPATEGTSSTDPRNKRFG